MNQENQNFKPLDEKCIDILPDFPHGPLDHYRNQASFCWKKMRLFMEEEGLLRYKMQVWKTLEEDPLFQHSPQTLTTDQLRRITFARLNRIKDYGFMDIDVVLSDPRKYVVLLEVLNYYDANLMLKFSIPFQFFVSSIRGMGTEKHQKYLEMADQRTMWGAFCMTEISHGTNTKKLRTTATFDSDTQEFILNTPDFGAAKCWAGALGQSCTHATVFAQLVTPNGQSKGLHAFIAPIRNPKTMLPYPGVIVGDMGEKLGLNAVDNGFAIFHNYRIPKDNLLDKTGSVAADGRYVTPFKDPNKRFGASLGSLMGGRMGIMSLTATNLSKAVVIAIRYSGVRRQFGITSDQEEIPVLEYQLQQWRLIPYLASAYVLSAFARTAIKEYMDFSFGLYAEDQDRMNDVGIEMHVLMSSAKPLGSWLAQHGIQVCREACGGHGYLRASGFGGLRDNNDANCTYEGANDVILQQTSNWLLGLWGEKQRQGGKLAVPFKSPLGSVSFLHDIDRATSAKFTAQTIEDLMNPEAVFTMYEWLICYLIVATEERYKTNLQLGKDQFSAKNDAQVFYARSLSLAFIEHFCMICFLEKTNAEGVETELKPILFKICALFGLWRLEKHLSTLYEGGFATGPAASQLIKGAILRLCMELKPDAVSLADAISPPDFVVNSVLGNSDGEVYKHLEASFYQTPGAFTRPSWWQEMVPKTTNSKL